jgi:hypothetical protein
MTLPGRQQRLQPPKTQKAITPADDGLFDLYGSGYIIRYGAGQ